MTTTRRQRERADRQAAILAAARDVFFEEGIRNATVDAIAARAQVAKGTVYIYFRSKETILATLLLEGLDSLNTRLAQAYEDAAPDPEAQLWALAAAYFQFSRDERDYFRLMMAFDRGQFRESIRRELYETILHRSLDGFHWLVRAVEQGLQEGRFAPGDARQIAGALWASLNGVLVLTCHPLRREMLAQEVTALYQNVQELMLRGLRLAPPAPPSSKEQPHA
ncbi:MAG: TetR/AcrR family transcriptional regulator [Anaerolineales bacterium]|nr:TetR/AcrR family transcriptional regulator [Anaerolineales bacterium]